MWRILPVPDKKPSVIDWSGQGDGNHSNLSLMEANNKKCYYMSTFNKQNKIVATNKKQELRYLGFTAEGLLHRRPLTVTNFEIPFRPPE